MERRILIVDDDQIFNTLLSDVFKQAGYTVHSSASADEALEVLKSEQFDLIVTDQRMPGTSGTQFVRKLMDSHKGLPVVMVSGFLNNDDIRQLIRDGIGGIFIKPLNIFQLLKRASQLIERSETLQKAEVTRKSAGANAPVKDQTPLSFRGARSALATKFFKQLENLRGFTSNLLVVGSEGTNFEILCQDLSDPHADTVFFVSPEDLDDLPNLAARLMGLTTQGQGRLTIVLDRIEEFGTKRAESVLTLARGKSPFDKLGQPVRFIFCLRSNLDDLFDAGKIDENLYLFMGTMELKVPSLNELVDDIPLIAQSILDRREGTQCKLDDTAVVVLKEMDWKGGTKQLETLLNEAASATASSVISGDTIRDAREGKLSVEDAPAKTDGLMEYLVKSRNEYASAMLALYGNNERAAADALDIPLAVLQSMGLQKSDNRV